MHARLKPRWLIAIAGIAILGGVWFLLAQPPGVEPAAKTVARSVLDFSLSSIDGGAVSLKDSQGHIRLLNFWATWCVPCRDEMPAIQAAFQTWRDQGLVVLSINEMEDHSVCLEFAQTFHLTFPILLDPDGITAKNLRIAGLPTSVFLDREGAIRNVKVGVLNFDYIENQLVAMGLSPVSQLTALATASATAEPGLITVVVPSPTVPARAPVDTPTPIPTSSLASGRLDLDTLYPLGEGRDLVLEICAGCHGLVPVAIVRRHPEGWAFNRATHEKLGLLTELSTAQIDAMYRYLNEYRNRDVPRQKIPQELLIECDA